MPGSSSTTSTLVILERYARTWRWHPGLIAPKPAGSGSIAPEPLAPGLMAEWSNGDAPDTAGRARLDRSGRRDVRGGLGDDQRGRAASAFPRGNPATRGSACPGAELGR